MPRKRPPCLDAPVVVDLRGLEKWAYLRCDEWKKAYRYTLINEFRCHITAAKNAVISAFELHSRMQREKANLYSAALGELAIVESNMDLMIDQEFNIMSGKQWSEAAKMIDNIRIALKRLMSSLGKGTSGSEPAIFGEQGVSAGYKDAELEKNA